MAPCVVVPASKPVGDIVAAMTAANATAVVVVDDAGRAVGILTERDVTRKIAFKVGADTPVARVMTQPVATVTADEHLYRVLGRMRRAGYRRIPVVDGAGRPLGIVDLNAALAAASARLMTQVDRLAGDDGVEGLSQTKRAQIELARALMDDRLPAPEIQRLITTINQDLHIRVLGDALQAMQVEGRGAPPVPFTLLIMGSGGRGESFLYPDQDNGFILADYPDADHDRIDAWFIALAERFTLELDRIGFPLCKGNVMATNPLWRKTASQWRAQVAQWIERRSPAALLFADIFFDFLPIWGDPKPAEDLRALIAARLKAQPQLLAAMSDSEQRPTVALGFFGRIATDSTGAYPGRVDLKRGGTLPLVGGARLLALRAGIAETGTMARIGALRDAGVIKPDEGDGLVAAFEAVTQALLRQQLSDDAAGRKVGNFVDPEALGTRARAGLVEALKRIDEFRRRVRAEFTGRLI